MKLQRVVVPTTITAAYARYELVYGIDNFPQKKNPPKQKSRSKDVDQSQPSLSMYGLAYPLIQ